MSHSTTTTILSCGCTAVCICALSMDVGCAVTATDAGDDTVSLTASEIKDGERFTLVDGESTAESRCDVRTVLTLTKKGTSPRDATLGGSLLYAHLRDEVSGDCKVWVDPNPREYALVSTGDVCGSKVYAASWTVDMRDRSLTLTDHRGRVCKDLVPAKIIVEERDESADSRTLYSSDKRRALPTS